MKINNRWKIVLIATSFAWLLEYSLRGINCLLKIPLMSFIVFANYFFYLAIMEDLIGRFKLKDYQVWIVAQFFGLLWQLVSVAGIYYPPFFLGVNIGDLLINNLVWWPTFQTVFAIYVARRLTPIVDRSRYLLSKKGLFVFFISYILISASWRLFITPPVALWQFLAIFSLILIFGFLSYQQIFSNIKKGIQPIPFNQDKFLDWVAIFSIVYFSFSFLFLTGGGSTIHLINRQALRVNLLISPLIAFSLLVKRLVCKKPIPV